LASASPEAAGRVVCDDAFVPLRLVVGAVGLALGGLALRIARNDPAFSFAGTMVGGAALVIAGWAMLFGALVFWARRPGNAVGTLLAAASACWFIAEWDNPGIGSSQIFTIGLVLFAACPPVVGWAMLAYPGGRLTMWAERLVIAAALGVGVVALGVLPTLYFDPAAQSCAQCPSNLLLLSGDPGRAADLANIGLRLGVASVLGLAGMAAWRFARSSVARRRVVAPVALAGCAYLGLVAWTYATGLDRGFVGTGGLERRLWLGQAAALTALGLAVGWGRVRVGRTRSSLTRLMVELGETERSGSLRDALANRLGDPELEVAYPIGDGRYAALDGRAVELPPGGGRSQTPLVRDGTVVAVIVHRRGLLDDPDLVEEVASAARLVLENERLRAELHAQEAELRASRARIVEAGDAERRRAERDLHDGAQQRLVGLLLGLRLARARLSTDSRGQAATRLDQATAELQGAVDDLRGLAHGIHPAVLSDEGLAAAIDSFADRAPAGLSITGVPQGRFPPTVETAAYQVVAEAARSGRTQVRAAYDDRSLVVDVETEVEPDVQHLEDRVGAVGGTLRIEPLPGGVRLHAVIPCPGLEPRPGGLPDMSGEVSCG
jgi:signal transduction histidine kinase